MKKSRLQSNWSLLTESVEGKHAKRFNAILETSDDVEFAKNYIKLLEYVRPKLQRKQIVEDKEEDRVIEIIHTYAPVKDEQF